MIMSLYDEAGRGHGLSRSYVFQSSHACKSLDGGLFRHEILVGYYFLGQVFQGFEFYKCSLWTWGVIGSERHCAGLENFGGRYEMTHW